MAENHHLPSLYKKSYSKIKRPRREISKNIAKQYWGTFVYCVEYPEGVFIDMNGKINIDVKESNDLSDSEFESLSPKTQQKILRNLKKEEIMEKEDMEYDYITQNEDYEVNDSVILDSSYIDFMQGDDTYICSDEEDEDIDEDDDDKYLQDELNDLTNNDAFSDMDEEEETDEDNEDFDD